jgi:hypothetical protein
MAVKYTLKTILIAGQTRVHSSKSYRAGIMTYHSHTPTQEIRLMSEEIRNWLSAPYSAAERSEIVWWYSHLYKAGIKWMSAADPRNT